MFVLCKNVCLCENFDDMKSRIQKFVDLKNGDNVMSMSSHACEFSLYGHIG